MKLICNLLLPGVLLALATSALAGSTPTPTAIPTPTATPTAIPGCGFTIEINALRGGSPTVAAGEAKKITAKARIAKGTSAGDATVHTTLQIDVLNDTGIILTQTSCPYVLEVGKGGQGTTLEMIIPPCVVGDSVRFRATFVANEDNDCSKPVCPLAAREITKTCK